MMDIVEWFMGLMLGAIGLLMVALVLALIFAGYLGVQCYRSGDPDSIACYMATGHTSRVKADVSIK